MSDDCFGREAQAAAVDTWYDLTGDFAGGTLTDYQVPAGITRIYRIVPSLGIGPAASSGSAIVRITGTGVKSQQDIVISQNMNLGTSVTAVANRTQGVMVNVPVIPGGTIHLQGKLAVSGDSGTPEFGVGLWLDGGQAVDGLYQTREATIAAENAWTVLNGLGGTTETDPLVPGGHTRIKQLVITGVGGVTAGVANMAIRLSGNALIGNQKMIPFGNLIAGAGTVTSCWVCDPSVFDCDIAVQGGNQLRIEASVNGADVGSAEVCVTVYTC